MATPVDRTRGRTELRVRGGVVLISHGRVAVIERRRSTVTYFLLPGGGCEPGETPADAAVREGREELGLRLRLRGLLAIVTFDRSEQHYFAADILGGQFGTGDGAEMANSPSSAHGSHRPAWLPLDGMSAVDLRPASIRDRIAGPESHALHAVAALIASPLQLHET